jgi:iron complex transport system ATP-binding protein
MIRATIRVASVAIERGRRRLLDDVSIEIEAGDLVGVVGPNGAGKSTLLRVLAGDLIPTVGEVELLGRDPAKVGIRHLARVRAFVGPQSVSETSFRVSQVVAMAREPHRRQGSDRSTDAKLVETAMQQADVDHLADREMRTLSSGEQQRVRIAMAMAQDTPVLLLDEPTSALDVGHQESIMKLLGALTATEGLVVTALHDLNLAAVHADKLVLMDRGRVAAFGCPREVLTARRLEVVYRQPMAVIDHPFRDCPLVLTKD